jgi:hypothetical protein
MRTPFDHGTDLYHGSWEGHALGANDFVLCADEKTSIQARRRLHPTTPPRPHQLTRVEHEYERLGAWAYLVAWDVQRAKLFSRCERKTGVRPFGRLVGEVMRQPPYCDAERVYWIVDNGSSHRGQRSIHRMRRRYRRYPELVLVHLPIHASWLNQVEIYLSIVQRKVLTPQRFQLPARNTRSTTLVSAPLRGPGQAIPMGIHAHRPCQSALKAGFQH